MTQSLEAWWHAGLREDELLFRFGDTEGWEEVAEPLGSVSFTQAWQCRRKSGILADHPDKAADISFAFPLWGPDAATLSAGRAHWSLFLSLSSVTPHQL